MKDSHHKSLFIFIEEILDVYGLPSVFFLPLKGGMERYAKPRNT